MQDRYRQLGKIHLQRTAGPYMWVIRDRGKPVASLTMSTVLPKAEADSESEL